MNVLRIVACLLAAGLAHAETPPPTLADLAWMAGCWESGEGDDAIREQWMTPAGRSMLGMSHTVAGGKTVAYEFLRIHEETDGIYYTATPSGQAESSFKLIKASSNEAIFEDPEHDFPQRITYLRAKDGGLIAIVEGMSEGALKRIEYPMQKVPCE